MRVFADSSFGSLAWRRSKYDLIDYVLGVAMHKIYTNKRLWTMYMKASMLLESLSLSLFLSVSLTVLHMFSASNWLLRRPLS